MKKLISVLGLCVCLCGQVAFGQVTSGTLVGTVTDSSGAVVPRARITVMNEGTGISFRSLTDQAGAYTITNLPAASYTIDVEAPGFKSVHLTHIVLLLNATRRMDLRLNPGATRQIVNVVASPPVINTDTSSIASSFGTESVESLPVNGRTLDRFIQLAAGNPSDSTSNPNLSGSETYGGDFYTVDGIGYDDTGNGGAAYSYKTALTTTPSIDTIQELKVVATNAKAESEGSAQISMLTKSGTDQFHGSMYEYNRNREFAAKNFFAESLPLPEFNRNEFGATLGGPIIRNRTFFFANYEGLRLRTAATPLLALGTSAMRQGDFTGLAPIVDPLTGKPFPNNQIPVGRLSPQALQLLQHVPLPDTAGTGPAGTGLNYVTSVSQPQDVNRATLKLDHHLGERNSFSAELNYSKGDPYFVSLNTPPNYGNYANGGYRVESAAATYTRIFTSNAVNDFRLAYFELYSLRNGQNLSFDPQMLFPQLFPPPPGDGGLPIVNITGFTGISDSGAAPPAPQITKQITDNFTLVRGAHAFKTGIDMGLNSIATPSGVAASLAPTYGNFTFNGRYSGSPYADFLLGDPVLDQRATPYSPNDIRYTRLGAYVQDDWNVSSRLTLNLGLRYELQTEPKERDGGMSNFDFATGKFVIESINGHLPSTAIPQLLSAYPYVTSEADGWGSDLLSMDDLDFGPRFGFAYRPSRDNRMVIRGGYGIYYNMAPVFAGIRQLSWLNPPFLLTESYEAAAGKTPSLTLADPFPGQGTISANPNIYAVNRNLRDTMSQQASLTVERELVTNLGLRVSYVHNMSTHAPWYVYNRNLPVTQAPGTIQSRVPFQPFASIFTTDNDGMAQTNQLQVELTRRYAGSLSLQSSYTWTKSIDNVPTSGTPQDPYDANLDRGNADGIRHQVFNVSAFYDLPFGPGKPFLHRAGRLAGGWRVTSIFLLRSGAPFNLSFTPTQAGWYATRPNVLGSGLYPASRSIAQWFNTSDFAPPVPFTFGGLGRNVLFGPGQVVLDAGVLKDTKINERFTLQFRAEAFNLPNHPNFSNPAANVSVASTAGRISSTSVDNRTLQFALRLLF
ncbi:MAG: carboxypeptidase regulatory-like domain-containing protein [Terriglobia bacterium]